MTITPRENLRGVIRRLEGTWTRRSHAVDPAEQSFTRREDPAKEIRYKSLTVVRRRPRQLVRRIGVVWPPR
jgi:hypothetical protein